jgi:hypothetical protein
LDGSIRVGRALHRSNCRVLQVIDGAPSGGARPTWLRLVQEPVELLVEPVSRRYRQIRRGPPPRLLFTHAFTQSHRESSSMRRRNAPIHRP